MTTQISTVTTSFRVAMMTILSVLAWILAADAGAQSQGPSVESCIGCHALGEQAPVGINSNFEDLHYIDLHPDGPASISGYRRLDVAPTLVDVTGTSFIIEFGVTNENGAAVDNVFETDGRFALAVLEPPDPMDPDQSGDPNEWKRIGYERFTEGGVFQSLGGGSYRYTAVFDPTTVPVLAGQTLRAAIQISAGDIPASNGWCDFDANLVMANGCVTPPSLTRDIVRTDTCNGCHGVTSDTRLREHGGRTEVEYCVTCHNPDRNPETGMTTLVHKIHYGSQLTQEWLEGEFDNVNFTRDIDNCTSCHMAGPVDADNWKTEPSLEACGSCHDDVNFATGENHGSGGQQLTNTFCSNCHPAEGVSTPALRPVATVHQGLARSQEGALYRGAGNGIVIESATFDRVAETLTVDYSVTRSGQKMNLATAPQWTNGGRLVLNVAWSTEDYTNEGSGRGPAQPVITNALDIGNAVTDLGTGSYRIVVDVSSFGFGTAVVSLEGHPNANILGDGNYVQIPVKSPAQFVNLESRAPLVARRTVVDINKCNACHDSSGAGLALHGNNRTSEMQVCVHCHNPDATDINRRPADPAMALDGKAEESIDMKRMIHQIHMGGDLEDPVVIYGFGGNAHDYSTVNFIGNSMNCLTCHNPGTYSTDVAARTLPSTNDTGLDVLDPEDDLNLSPVTSVCSSCHDTQRATSHMVAFGGTFGSLDSEIATVPEPDAQLLAATALSLLGLLARRRLHR